MAKHSLDFDTLFEYKAIDSGITVETTIGFSDLKVTIQAKIDTGSTLCIFERVHGEKLGLEIETGIKQRISTAKEYSRHTVLELDLPRPALNSTHLFTSLTTKTFEGIYLVVEAGLSL